MGGQKRTLFFDYTFADIKEGIMSEEAFMAMAAKSPFRVLPLVTYAALLSGEDVNELPEGFSERMASRWLMELTEEQNGLILKTYNAAMGFISNSFQAVLPPAKGAKQVLKASQ